jgi:hypothetical protein
MKAQHNPRAATFRDRDNHVVGTTWGGTWCWHPVNPAKYASESEDGTDAHLIRCRRCPGCMELDRRELAERLVLTFNKEEGNVWVVVIEVVLAEAGEAVRKFALTLSGAKSWGWCRIGASRIAVIVAGQKPRSRVRQPSIGCSVCWHRVLVKRKRRAWSMVTAGMLYSRDVYGEQTNRWYMRGLKRVPRAKRVGVWRGRARQKNPELQGGVAGVRDGIRLCPPEAYRPPRLVKRRVRGGRRFAGVRGKIEPIGKVLADLPSMLASTTLANYQLSPGRGAAVPKSPNFGRREARTAFEEQRSIPLTARYSSSRVDDRAEIDAWVARMTAKARARGDPDA